MNSQTPPQIVINILKKRSNNISAISISIKLPFTLKGLSSHEELYLKEQLLQGIKPALLICFGQKVNFSLEDPQKRFVSFQLPLHGGDE